MQVLPGQPVLLAVLTVFILVGIGAYTYNEILCA
jgi:hypothetical protein